MTFSMPLLENDRNGYDIEIARNTQAAIVNASAR
jgi:hypothetical protein